LQILISLKLVINVVQKALEIAVKTEQQVIE